MIGPDEEMVLPESINLCHHFENIRHCSRSEADRNHGHCHTTEAVLFGGQLKIQLKKLFLTHFLI